MISDFPQPWVSGKGIERKKNVLENLDGSVKSDYHKGIEQIQIEVIVYTRKYLPMWPSGSSLI